MMYLSMSGIKLITCNSISLNRLQGTKCLKTAISKGVRTCFGIFFFFWGAFFFFGLWPLCLLSFQLTWCGWVVFLWWCGGVFVVVFVW